MENEYVEMKNGGYYVRGIRVSLDSIVAFFNSGQSAEEIQYGFPCLKLEHVYGAITFYLAHKDEVDRNIRETDEEFSRLIPPLSVSNPEKYARLMKLKEQMAQRQ